MRTEHRLDPFFGRHYATRWGDDEPFGDLYALYWFAVLGCVLWLPALIRELRGEE